MVDKSRNRGQVADPFAGPGGDRLGDRMLEASSNAPATCSTCASGPGGGVRGDPQTIAW